jgi:RimK family alpha-L-glutamate ligase
MPRFALIAHEETTTNLSLLAAARRLAVEAALLSPAEARRRLCSGDTALARLDVLPTLAGPEPGLDDLRALESNGVTVLNRAEALVGAHDKLVTAIRLGAQGLPHPRTAHIGADVDPGLGYPVVVKPRFGSWGQDVHLCISRQELKRCLRSLTRRDWFHRQGALVQELIQPQGHDLRLIVAAGRVIGAIERIAAAREWRTNIALGGSRRSIVPPPRARLLALEAANTLGADLVGVDLLPDGTGQWTILELNGAADFSDAYNLNGEDAHEQAIRSLLDGQSAEATLPTNASSLRSAPGRSNPRSGSEPGASPPRLAGLDGDEASAHGRGVEPARHRG